MKSLMDQGHQKKTLGRLRGRRKKDGKKAKAKRTKGAKEE